MKLRYPLECWQVSCEIRSFVYSNQSSHVVLIKQIYDQWDISTLPCLGYDIWFENKREDFFFICKTEIVSPGGGGSKIDGRPP